MSRANVAAGDLQSVDGYMNIALERTEEFVNGAKRRSYGDAFVRGNNGESSQAESISKGKSLFHINSTLTTSIAVMYISADS